MPRKRKLHFWMQAPVCGSTDPYEPVPEGSDLKNVEMCMECIKAVQESVDKAGDNA